jgi:anti-sigma factor RsiW
MAESPDHLTCRELVELVTDYLEGALPAEELVLFEQHLNLCQGCEWHLEQVRATIATLGLTPDQPPPAETRARLLAVFRDRS